jgi:hypothetical protein
MATKKLNKMNKKQPFTIEGSVALKKALLEETGLDLHTQVCASIADNNKEAMGKMHFECVYDELDSTPILALTECIESTHYQLPQDWDKAVKGVKDFFAEEKFKKGKWYYAEIGDYEFMFKVKDSTDSILNLSEKIMYHPKTKALYTIDDFISKNSEADKNSQPATTEQIQEMLGKVAESKGFVKSIKVRSLFANNIDVIDGGFNYELSTDSLWTNGDNNLIEIYNKGKWAELLPQEEPKPEKLLLQGVKVKLPFHEQKCTIELNAAHLQQIKAYFTK